jgi:hypothetical protein
MVAASPKNATGPIAEPNTFRAGKFHVIVMSFAVSHTPSPLLDFYLDQVYPT